MKNLKILKKDSSDLNSINISEQSWKNGAPIFKPFRQNNFKKKQAEVNQALVNQIKNDNFSIFQ